MTNVRLAVLAAAIVAVVAFLFGLASVYGPVSGSYLPVH